MGELLQFEIEAVVAVGGALIVSMIGWIISRLFDTYTKAETDSKISAALDKKDNSK